MGLLRGLGSHVHMTDFRTRGPPFFSASVSSGHVVLFEIMDAFNFAFYQGTWNQRPSGMSAYKLHHITILITVLSGVR